MKNKYQLFRGGFTITLLVLFSMQIQANQSDQVGSQFDRMVSLFEQGRQAQQTAHYMRAISFYRDSLAIAKELRHKPDISLLLGNIGTVYSDLGQYTKALEYYEQVLIVEREVGNQNREGKALDSIGKVYSDLGQYTKALEYYEQVLIVVREVGNQNREGNALDSIGKVYSDLGQYTKALEYYEQVLIVEREVGNQNREGNALGNIGNVYRGLGQYAKALEYFEQALVLLRKIGDRHGEGSSLVNIGGIYGSQDQFAKAIEYYNQALIIDREIGNQHGEAEDLDVIGRMYAGLSLYPKAVEYYKKALVLARKIGDRHGERNSLGNIGTVYLQLSNHSMALEYYEQAREIAGDIGGRLEEGNHLGNIGTVYKGLGQYNKALEYYEQALIIEREIGDRVGEGKNLVNIGNIYLFLNQASKALEYYKQSLIHKSGSQYVSGETLNNIGLGQYSKALEYLERALVVQREIGDRNGERADLTNIGSVYLKLDQYSKALVYYELALVISHEIGDPGSEGLILNNIGYVYRQLGQYPKALKYYEQALTIQSTIDAPEVLYKIWNGMSSTQTRLKQMSAAIFAGKQAVNIIQAMRATNTSLKKGLQKSFLKNKKYVYQNLAAQLIDQGRIPEAEQVLAMLKEEEYFDFIRRDGKADNRGTRASHTSTEQAQLDNYQHFSKQLVSIGKEYTVLEQREQLSSAEQQRFTELEVELDKAQYAFLEVIIGLGNYFKTVSADKTEAHSERQLGLLESKQELLTNLGHGAVLIHTVTAKNKLHLLLTTPNSQLARISPIGEQELNRLVNDFRQILQQPNADPKPLAQQLYNYLIKPLENDLQLANAKTLMWSLDGTLRYIPLAALHDGEKYLLERYSLVLYTAAASDNLKRDNNTAWRLAGLGVSKKYRDFSALKAVPEELNSIILEGENDKEGVIPGVVYLNEAFDKPRFKQILREGYPALHIASHFRLQPGDSNSSHLLLGDGEVLSLEDFRTKRAYKMQNVDLLTLSACNTAMGDKGEGGEVESFGVLAQKRGAAGVLATLWSVADQSTGQFMREFYRLRSENPGLTKADALRQAQLSFLTAEKKVIASPESRGFNKDSESLSEQRESLGYRHPYYWAPFILMGNWL